MDSAQNFGPQVQNNVTLFCRICLEESSNLEPSNFLIHPCGCKGTAEFVHSECLIKWIKKSTWRKSKGKDENFILCEMCKTPIYFHVGSQSWASWYKNKPCSAVFYLLWIILLLLSFIAIVFMVTYAIATKEYQVLRFLGLPLGFFGCGSFLFYYCGKDFRDYQTNIITIRQQDNNERKISSSSSNLQN